MTVRVFAPLWFFYRRCMQTFAVLLMVFLAFLAHAMRVVVWLFLLLTPIWPIAVLYGTFVIVWDRDKSSNGGRRVNFIRNSSLWNYYCEYFPIQLVKTVDLDSKKNYIFSYHPHGIMAGGAFGHFATNGSGFDKVFPGFKPYLLVMKSENFYSGCYNPTIAGGPLLPLPPYTISISLLFASQEVVGLIQSNLQLSEFCKGIHCVKSVQIRSFFWSVFSCSRTEYVDLLRKTPYSVRMQENTDQKKLRIWTLITQW